MYDDNGLEVAVEYEGTRLPNPGHYRLCSDGKWWKLDKPQLAGDNYISVGSGVKSVLDDKVYTNGYAYADHLKKNNAVLIGNDFASRAAARQERMAARAEAKKSKITN